MKIRAIVVAIFAGLTVLTVAVWAAQPPNAITRWNVFSFYRGFKLLTPTPRTVGFSLATLCTTPTARTVEAMKAYNGPHFEAHIRLFANEPGTQRRSPNDTSPAGTVIVKQKLDDQGDIAAVGGMRKREPGFDAANGDWEYFYATSRLNFTIGKIDTCVTCHARTKETDFVYSAGMLVQRPAATAAPAR